MQKSLILSATLFELYSSNYLGQNRDISIQAFATNSILQQHHYGSVGGKSNVVSSGSPLSTTNTSLESGQFQTGSRLLNQAFDSESNRSSNTYTDSGNSSNKNSISDSVCNINNIKLRNPDSSSLGNINTGLALYKATGGENTQQTTSQVSFSKSRVPFSSFQ